MGLRQIELDSRGLDYVRDHLRDVNFLCSELLKVVEDDGGQVFTLIPDYADERQAYQFEAGGLLRENLDMSRLVSMGPGRGSVMVVVDLADERARLILDGLNAHPGAVCICDDFNWDWSEKIARSTPKAFGVVNETYHHLCAQDGLEVVAGTLRMTDTVWHGVAAICRRDFQVPASRSVEPPVLAECAASVVELSCTAYDREGFVVWRRNGG